MSSLLPISALRRQEVFETLDTAPQGLIPQDADQRRKLYGPNQLADPPAASAWRRWLGYTAHPMAILLWVAGAAACFIGRVEMGVVIWGVVLVNAAFSYWRERRASQAVAVLKRLLPVYGRVVRNSQEIRIPASEIVPGDLISLAEGDRIPADARIVEANGLRVNNATLTGESLPALRTADASLRDDLTEIERPNLVFAGTSVLSGTGKAIVYATGMLTQFGRIANLTQSQPESPSLIQAQMERISRLISITALMIGAVVFLVSFLQVGISIQEAFILSIGILVAAIPEGLVPTVTLSLAMAVQRLAQRNVLVKKLSSVETLGTTSVICTDKSGTLTQNQMTVRRIWTSGAQIDITGTGYSPQGEFTPSLDTLKQNGCPITRGDIEMLCISAMLCNNSRLVEAGVEHTSWTSLGDQTEAALRVMALKWGLDEGAISAAYPRLHELPFDARRKRMSTIHRGQAGEVVFVKGAPKEVLQLCTHIRQNSEVVPLDTVTRLEILGANDLYARSAMRVLALAQRELPPRSGSYTPENIEKDLTFLGLAGMMDPPRPEVTQAVQTFQKSGVRMVMITGDYGLTAESLARRVGMLTTPSPRIVTGADLDALSNPELQDLLESEVIYSRMAPEHKLRLVSALQEHGEVVAVIGDGVNDTPALRKADIGIAMGIGGTDVAREAADVVLVDDNFMGVVYAIEEGRAIFDNLRKFITYIFASNIPEIFPFILTALFNLPLALTVPQILAIDLGTDLIPAFALGTEPPEPGVMQRPPVPRSRSIIDSGLLQRAFLWLGGLEAALCYFAFFGVYHWAGYPIMSLFAITAHHSEPVYLLAITVFHAGVVMAQAGNMFACRSESRSKLYGWRSNKYIWIGLVVELVMLVATIYVPPLARLFDHRPLPLIGWVGLGLFAPVLFGLEQGRKWLADRANQSRLIRMKKMEKVKEKWI